MQLNNISIHKALTGLDDLAGLLCNLALYFNPQGPHGPRLCRIRYGLTARGFQSTRPSRASTSHASSISSGFHISIHKALTGLDVDSIAAVSPPTIFQSTRPSRASTRQDLLHHGPWTHFNPQGPHGPRLPELIRQAR